MKKLKLLLIFFCAALSIPLGYFIMQTHHSLDQEEIAALRYFAETLFTQMEDELSDLVVKEEARAIDEYTYFLSLPGKEQNIGSKNISPLSRPMESVYIIGHFQNNPDGSFQTPIVESLNTIPKDRVNLVNKLKAANTLFNQKRTTLPEKFDIAKNEFTPKPESKDMENSLADKYLELPKMKSRKSYLGQAKKRIEKVPMTQAFNIAKTDRKEERMASPQAQVKGSSGGFLSSRAEPSDAAAVSEDVAWENEAPRMAEQQAPKEQQLDGNFQVEVDPMQSVFLNDTEVFIFRRIMIDNKIYRQGFVLDVSAFLNHLSSTFFSTQPMAKFSGLELTVRDGVQDTSTVHAGTAVQKPVFLLERTFPRPFSFLHATIGSDNIPKSKGRKTLNIMMGLMAAVIILGMFAIYQSTRSIVDLSERRTTFVSSVTHELKTPLTNIRMYIEMLEQGIARDRDREEDYFRILGSESSRLSRLINNVLEFSKLEKKTRHFDLEKGDFDDVIREVSDIMQEKLKQEGFTLTLDKKDIPLFKYDREVMIQILINLMENSMKFGKTSPVKEITLSLDTSDQWINIRVSDTGPGIPRTALKKIFDDFYRVDNTLTRTTGGTGIGLALVKKFVTAMGGKVGAENNQGAGCTIMISLPT